MFRSMKRFDALETIIALFSLMNQAVYFQSLSKTKCLIASSACVIFQHCGLTCDGIFYCIQHNCPTFPHYVSACDPLTGYDEYSLLYSTRDFFPLLVPYSEILLLGRVHSVQVYFKTFDNKHVINEEPPR